MATLNMRYGGNIISIPEGANYSPQNFGTARLKFRVNAQSVGEFGLTTNTNAKEYCALQLRVGGQICHIGRVSSTTYISGNYVDYHGSVVGVRNTVSASASESKTSTAKVPITYYSSSMRTSSSQYTKVTSTEVIQSNSYTQQVLSKTEIVSYSNGSGNATSAAAPLVRTSTNATGSTVTSRTASAAILTNSSYRETRYESATYLKYSIYKHTAPSSGSVNQSVSRSYITNSIMITGKVTYENWNSHAGDPIVSTVNQTDYTGTVAYNFGASYTTKANGALKTTLNSSSTKLVNGNWSETHSFIDRTSGQTVVMTKTDSVRRTYSTSELHFTNKSSSNYGKNSTTYGSYSTRWTYYWTSCKYSKASYYSTRTVREYSTRSYTGTTYYASITRSTTSVSETIHNMNI